MWFGVRHVIRNGPSYEERVTLWEAASFDEAIARAEPEAAEYASLLRDAEALSMFQAYQLPDPPGDGGEVFSLIRESELGPSDYLDKYFDTGTERQSDLETAVGTTKAAGTSRGSRRTDTRPGEVAEEASSGGRHRCPPDR